MLSRTETKTYVVCPCCDGNLGSIDHLMGNKVGSTWLWYCDGCGARVKFAMEGNEVVSTEPTGEKSVRTIDFLKHGDIGLIVEGMAFAKDGKVDLDGKEYWYNEHTCPTNYLKNVLAIVDLKTDDYDPHGIFEYVGTTQWNPQVSDWNCSFDFRVYKEMFDGNN